MGDIRRHVLSLSGGKDSAALAVYMRDRAPEMEYVFHDTGKELPETYDYIERLEAFLGRPVTRTTSEHSFDRWLDMFGGMIPSNHRRWCTKMLKLKPFERYVGDDPVYNYIGLRADEKRDGYISHKASIVPVYPFRDDGIDRAGVIQILEQSGLGLPKYTAWGRTRSGCFFCFYQQKIEWVRLYETYPELYAQAEAYEYANRVNGNPFYWCGDESLEELRRAERTAAIKANWESGRLRARAAAANRPLVQILGGLDDGEPEAEGCWICHK